MYGANVVLDVLQRCGGACASDRLRPPEMRTHRRTTCTTNLLGRLVLVERRRLKIIPSAFGERPMLKLMFAAMARAAQRWRANKITDFKRRQLAALRIELDQEYEPHTGLNRGTSKAKPQTRLSSKTRT
jgi:hypothetical protein